MQPPGDKIPDQPFDEMSAEWQEFIRTNLIASPLRERIGSINTPEEIEGYLQACIDMLNWGLLKIEITDDWQFKISGAGITHH